MVNVVTTTFGGRFTICGINLIKSIQKYSDDVVDKIIVWNIGDLSKDSINKIKSLYNKVKVIDKPEEINSFYSGYLNPRQFGHTAMGLHYTDGDNILWIDSCQIPCCSLEKVFKIIEEDEFFTGTLNHNTIAYRKRNNSQCTSTECLDRLNVTEDEKHKPMNSGGIIGYKRNGKYQKVIDDLFKWSKIKEVWQGPNRIHNQDQSIMSILLARTEYKMLNIKYIEGKYLQMRIYRSKDDDILKVLRVKKEQMKEMNKLMELELNDR